MITKDEKAYNLKRNTIIISGIFIFCFVVWFILSRMLFALGEPNEELQNAITFIQEEKYIGMTLEECEVVFGDSQKESPVSVLTYSAGTFTDGWWPGRYEIVIYFDQYERVKYVSLQEIKE